MKKLSKIAQVTFFAAAFAVLFSGTADAYIDPSVMNYAIQAVAYDLIPVVHAVEAELITEASIASLLRSSLK